MTARERDRPTVAITRVLRGERPPPPPEGGSQARLGEQEKVEALGPGPGPQDAGQQGVQVVHQRRRLVFSMLAVCKYD
jgi:hypothetical protein